MDTNKLKKLAQEARTYLMGQVTSKLALVLAEGSAARREAPAAIQELERAIRETPQAQVIEKVAYTWFNRFTALRFMDANGYTNPRVVTPAEGATRPEILADAAAGHFDEALPPATKAAVSGLLDGRLPSRDAQGEAYRLLLVAACNHWHARMPFMFEKIADYTELLMPEDLLSSDSVLARLRTEMTDEDCQDVEVIGWLYQFYISEKKDQVFAALKKNVKIAPENIPAATQLFTPHWIVRYLVENSLGRLWLLNRPASKLAEKMDYYIAPEEPEADFLRISRPEDIRICDPACGSGHMLTYAFDLLHAIYEEEGYEASQIPGLILSHNLTGIEIDDRAGALAAFALTMKAAARLGRRRFLRFEVQPNICVLQDVRFTNAEMEDVAAIVGRDLFTSDLRETLAQFERAKNFGSLILPKLRDSAEVARVVRQKDFGGDLLLRDVHERVLKVLEMAEALSPKYHAVVANPPYAGAKGLNDQLVNLISEQFKEGKSDLYSAFIVRILRMSLLDGRGISGLMTPFTWMFLSNYEELRAILLLDQHIDSLIRPQYSSFEGATVPICTFVVSGFQSPKKKITFVDLASFRGWLKQEPNALKAIQDANCPWRFTKSPEGFSKIPTMPLAYTLSEKAIASYAKGRRLADVCKPRQGIKTGNNDLFLRFWHEVDRARARLSRTDDVPSRRWFACSKGGDFRKWYGNNEYVLDWERDGQRVRGYVDGNGRQLSRPQNVQHFFKGGLTWSTLTIASISMRLLPEYAAFESKGSTIPESDPTVQTALLGFLNSSVVNEFMKAISPTMDYGEGAVGRLPVLFTKIGHSSDIDTMVKIARRDWDANETSWDFTSLPLLAFEYRSDSLEATYTLLRAQWRGMAEEMKRLDEENNRIFIDAYGLQSESSPEVSLEEITLTCNPAYRYGGKLSETKSEERLLTDSLAEFLHYAVGCMFGRYSLDAPGLILANQGETLADYLARVPEPSFMPDENNVLPVLDGDWFADDVTERFRKFLRVTFGEAKFQENLAFIEAALGKDIRKWFTRDFFDYHVRRYKKRPIYWMFSSPKGSFNALIYMHRYRPDTVSVVLNEYLREFISKLQTERVRLEKLVDDPNAAQSQKTKALKDVNGVIKQIDELTAWERDVVFPLAQAKIEIDLDDGVKRNYPKFGSALKPIKGLEAADE